MCWHSEMNIMSTCMVPTLNCLLNRYTKCDMSTTSQTTTDLSISGKAPDIRSECGVAIFYSRERRLMGVAKGSHPSVRTSGWPRRPDVSIGVEIHTPPNLLGDFILPVLPTFGHGSV